MKKINIQYILQLTSLLYLFSFSSCKKEMMEYEGVDGVYFAVQHGASYGNELTWPYQPYTNWEFIKTSKTESTIQIKVMITGSLKNYDRVFQVVVNPDSTTATVNVHYKPIVNQITVPAGAISATVPVTLLRAPDLKKEKKVLGLKLVANENFGLSFTNWDALPSFTAGTIVKKFDASLHSININDFLVQPAVWIGSIQQGNRESGLWGAFTQKKIELMFKIMDLTYEDFASTQVMPGVRSSLLTELCTKYLLERYNAGNPVLEDDGRLMYIGSVPWTSYIGIPWVRN